MKFEISAFIVKRDGLSIRGKKFEPERPALGSMIISHGFMDNQEHDVRKYAEEFAWAGYRVYTFDFCGGCIKGSSDGDSRNMSVLTEVKDLEAVMRFVLEEQAVGGKPSSKVILMGCSQGGFVSALTAAKHPDEVERLILFYPALCIPDDARSGQMIRAKFDPKNIPDELSCGPMKLGRIYPEDVIGMDSYAEIRSYPGPVLIVHGSGDKLVNVSYSEKALAAYEEAAKEAGRESRCELVILEKAGHGFRRADDDKAKALVREFLGRTVSVTGRRFLPTGQQKDTVKNQIMKDIFFQKNEMHIDERFVLRDGKKHPFAVITPGGGYYVVCSFIEGVPIARQLNEKGISVFIVYYRVKKKAAYPGPQDDLAAAVKQILDHADEYNVLREGYSVWGASAGGHLAASFGTDNMGYQKYGLPKPGAMVLIYPVILMDPALTHRGTRDLLIGEKSGTDQEAFASIDEHVTKDYPPTYIWCGDADSCVPAENTRRMRAALEAAGVPYQCDIFENVDHGVGPASGTSAEGWIGRAAAFWEKQRGARD